MKMRSPFHPLLAGAALAACLAAPLAAQDFDEPDPWDLVPRRISPTKLSEMSAAERYMAALAIRHGRTILVTGCSASDSRTILLAAAKDRGAALALMRDNCPG